MTSQHSTPFNARKLLVSTALCAIATTGLAVAQDDSDAEQKTLDQVVVVGTPGGAGISKLDASFAVTTVDDDAIEKFSPKSTADLLKLVPGVWVESSGGVAGANVFVRGFPGAGDAEFLTVSINGSPIYPPSTLSFLENTTLFRIDETVDGMEGLRGGPNSVFSNGQIGLTTNFRLKEGGEDFEGLVKYSTSDFGLQRFDGYASGEIADGLYYMVGGYIRSSSGIRDTQFSSEEGSQFTVNLTKELDNGKLNLFTRVTDDHGAWHLPFAVNVPGLDLGTHAQLGNATRFRELQVNANGDTEVFDFADGRGWDGQITGGSAEFDLGNGWTLRDNFTYTSGDADTFGFVPDGGAVQVGDVLTATGGTGISTLGGVALADTDFVQNYGHWVVKKDIEAIVNDLSLAWETDRNTLTVGYYTSTFSSDDFWTIGNFTPVQVQSNGDFLDSSVSCADLAAAGSGSGCWAFGLESAGDGNTNAVYAADSFQVTERLRLDLGVRYEDFETDYVLDSGPGFPDGSRDMAAEFDKNETSWTVGLNYDLNDYSGVFGRYSSGVKFPSFDDIRSGFTGVKDVDQFEAGYKLQTNDLSLFATGFYNEFSGATFIDIGGRQGVDTNEAYGIELDGVWYGPEGFQVAANATWQETEVTESSDPTIVGNEALRQPGYQLRISPSYDYTFANGWGATLYGTLTAVDDRFSDSANTQTLDSYEKLDLGLIVSAFDDRVEFQVAADNLTDEEGLTEGDPRSSTSANARPILGRSFKFSIGYKF